MSMDEAYRKHINRVRMTPFSAKDQQRLADDIKKHIIISPIDQIECSIRALRSYK